MITALSVNFLQTRNLTLIWRWTIYNAPLTRLFGRKRTVARRFQGFYAPIAIGLQFDGTTVFSNRPVW